MAPDFVYLEVANALVVEHRSGRLPAEELAVTLNELLAVPLAAVASKRIAREAALTAVARGLSVYDASYALLAEANDALLVTADRKLAAATARSELIV